MSSVRSPVPHRLAATFAIVAAMLSVPAIPGAAEYVSPQAFVLLDDARPESQHAFARTIERGGGHVAVFLSPAGTAIVFADDRTLADPPVSTKIRATWRGSIDASALANLEPAAATSARAWNASLRIDLSDRPGAGKAAAEARESALPDAGPRPVALGAGEPKHSILVSNRLPYGAEYYDTSEFMAGTVAVGVWLLESDTHTYDWTTLEETTTLGGIQASLANWVRKGGPPAALTFHLDVHTAVPVTGEPIEHLMGDDQLFVNEFLGALGWPGANAFEKCFAYNNSIRDAFDTHWCYSVVVVDSDPLVNQGLFSGGGYAWAYYGGPWIYMSRFSSWAYNANRYAGVVPMHESGHIFMCTDEYNSVLQYGGYLNIIDSPPSVACIMNRNDSTYVCQPTRGQLGLWDSDADGALDVMDVEPSATIAMPADTVTEVLPTAAGFAAVNTLDNRNPLSNYVPPHDQTIATIDAVEARVDGGSWSAALAADGDFDGYQESFTWIPSAPLALGEHVVEARARTSVGVWNTSYSTDTFVVRSNTAVGDPSVRDGFALHPPRPNPARDRVHFGFHLSSESPIEITVLDVAGRVVRSLLNGRAGPGEHAIEWDARDARGRRLPAGVYVVRARAAGVAIATRAMVLR